MTLRDTAYEHAQHEGLSPIWKQAYMNLFQAADYLDAVHGRASIPLGMCTVPEHQQFVLNGAP